MNFCTTCRATLLALALPALAACGVETAGTAATAGAMRVQEIEQGRVVQQQLQQSMDQTQQQRAEQLDQATR
jgi:hypothetical protein